MAQPTCDDLPGTYAVYDANGVLTCVPIGQDPNAVTMTWTPKGIVKPFDWTWVIVGALVFIILVKK